MSTEPLLGVGSTIGSYRVVAMLGRGGMGVVYRAEDLRLGRHVALKLLPAALAADVRYRERFLRESRLAASIEHAAILPIYEAGEADGLLYMSMRFVDGVDLAELLRREGPLEPERAVAVVGQLASALDAAHARGLIHRDVKPSNALIGRDSDGEHAYLVDFGITQEIASADRLTATGQVVGTLDYLAPERLRGEEVDGRVDIYALGCVLFQCLTGQAPFKRDSEAATIYAHLEEPPPRASRVRAGVPAALDDVVASALAKDRGERYATGAALRAAARAATEPGPVTAGSGRPGLPRRGVLAALVLLVLAIVAGGALLVGEGGDEDLTALGGDAVGRIDAEGGDLLASYPVGRDPGALAVGAGFLWASSQRDDTVSRIDPTNGSVVAIPVGDDPAGMAFAGGLLWVANRAGRRISQIDPESNRVGQEIEVGNAPRAIAAGFGALWVALEVDRKVARIDIARGARPKQIDIGGSPTSVATGAGAVWVTSEESGAVFRIEPGSGAVSTPIDVGNFPAGIVVADGAVWVANRQDGTVSRIDPTTDSVTETVRVGPQLDAIAAGAGGVWVGDAAGGRLLRIDTKTRRVADRIRVGGSPSALAIEGGTVWTAARASPATHRGGTLRVELFGAPRDLDLEATAFSRSTYELLPLAYDGLVGYRRTDGSTYGGLVGALAVSVPEPSADGKTYVFRLRRGIRYSDGTPVRPEDFRASLERVAGHPDIPHFYEHIVGAAACLERPTSCDLSQGIVTDATAGTITIHLREPDPDLLHKLALPFALVAPADRPFRPKTAPPGTGPYRIAGVDRDRGVVRLVRNSHFRPRALDARPDGFPDEIQFVSRAVDDLDGAASAVQRGESDSVEVVGPFGSAWSPARIEALARRAAGRLHTDAVAALEYMWLNTQVPPFDDVRVRRAANFAADRLEIARRAGGPDLVQLTCQLTPPGFPGHTPSCPYTANPNLGGGWSAPDIDRARRLIKQSGTKGQKVAVWGWAEKHAILQYFVSLLRSLGYRARLREYPDFERYYMAGAADSRKKAQIGLLGYSSDLPIASEFTAPFRCASYTPASRDNFNQSQFCDRQIDEHIDEASAARGADADAAWRDVYRRLERAAPAVPLFNRRVLTLVSKRVGNYQHHPLFGPLYEQMWVR